MVEPIKGDVGFVDRRARLSPKPDARRIIFGPRDETNILNPLYETGGFLWPYTPTLFDQQNVIYDSYDPVHTNQPFAAFNRVAIKEIVCTGAFTAQNQAEARYCVAAIHFLRTITKMFFGTRGSSGVDRRGTPPPILLFNAYGTAIFHNIPVIVTNYNVEFPQDVDYVRVLLQGDAQKFFERQTRDVQFSSTGSVPGNLTRLEVDNVTGDISAWVPTRFIISVNMQVQNTPDRLRRNFNLDSFRTGSLIKNGGWI